MKKHLLNILLMLTPILSISAQEPVTNAQGNSSSGYINIEGGKIYFESAGAGENIVLIHDGMVHNSVWDGQFSVMAKNYHVFRYDRRGYGKSSAPESRFSNIEDLNQLFLQLKIDKAILFGMSAGGGLAIDFTLKYPEKVTSLVLVGAVVSGYGYSTHMFNRGGHLTPSIAASFSDPKKYIQYFVNDDPYTIYPENKSAKEKLNKLMEANLQNAKGARTNLIIPYQRPAVRFLNEIKVPALVVVGEFDIPDVHAHAGVIEAGIPSAKREIIANAGHLVPWEKPNEFNQCVFNFLNKTKFNNLLKSSGGIAAAEYYLKRLEADPSFKILDRNEMHNLASSYYGNTNFKEAIEICKLYTLTYPDSEYAFQFLGDAYAQSGQKDLAIKSYQKSLEIKPGFEPSRQALEDLKKK
jgi:pimeloyl-ACP methyl ester carboxylesterase